MPFQYVSTYINLILKCCVTLSLTFIKKNKINKIKRDEPIPNTIIHIYNNHFSFLLYIKKRNSIIFIHCIYHPYTYSMDGNCERYFYFTLLLALMFNPLS